MAFLKRYQDFGPLSDADQISLLYSYIGHNVPFLMIRSGKTLQSEVTAVREARVSYDVGPDVLCLRVEDADLDQFVINALNENLIQLFEDGFAIPCPATPSYAQCRSDVGNISLFLKDLIEDESGSALLPHFASAMKDLLEDQIPYSDASDADKIKWNEMQSTLGRLGCTDQLIDCADYVMDVGFPLLVWHLPASEAIEGSRLVARKVDHWVVPTFA